MSYSFSERHKEIISRIVEQVQNRFPENQTKLIEQFISHYLELVSDEDLSGRTIEDLYGSVLSLWNFVYQRRSNQNKVQVFNPTYEQHGWHSQHTIIEIITPEMPFSVDSVRMELIRRGLMIHLMIHPGTLVFRRNKQGYIQEIELVKHNKDKNRELPIYIEIDQQLDSNVLDDIRDSLIHVLDDVRITVEDWHAMLGKTQEIIHELEQTPPPIEKAEVSETIDFLKLITNNNFTFLGVRDYVMRGEKGKEELTPVPDSGLGMLRQERSYKKYPIKMEELSPEAREIAFSKAKLLVIQQLQVISTVHRPAEPYYIGLKRINPAGEVIGERRFIGLFTSSMYHTSPTLLPFLRRKVDYILKNSNLRSEGHSWKTVMNIIETFPRDELIQASEGELLTIIMGIFQMQERQRIRLFMRKDPYNRFFSCLVYIPQNKFEAELSERLGEILRKSVHGYDMTFNTWLSELSLARIHYMIKTDSSKKLKYPDVKALEEKLVAATRSWEDELKDALYEFYGEAKSLKLFKKYAEAFPAGYREFYSAHVAVRDIDQIEALNQKSSEIRMSLYRPLEGTEGELCFKLYCKGQLIPLSDILPMLENMGLRVIAERSYNILHNTDNQALISDFEMYHEQAQGINVEKIRPIFQEAFAKIWYLEAENDGFNRLVLSAELNWREVALIRSYAKYLRQIGFTFSQQYIEEALAKYPKISRLLIKLFTTFFDPQSQVDVAQKSQEIINHIIELLDTVESLDHDRIFRRFLDLILATLRTNFYSTTEKNNLKSYISLKFDPKLIPEIPLPTPQLEFFVYSPRVEGVHLRSAKVARGGIRWSDRREDFRTEVLGLMKAQSVKNSVIVPAGAKGGFVCKMLPENGSREDIQEEVIACYSTFIKGLLDLTDNREGNKIIYPENVVRRDNDDFYLVVAADKGTATFSDIANSISAEYNFWLGDAFASGGSAGYDHKKMGITAKSAWESVKRHFYELNNDFENNDFTVVGIGDMSGDVFGNGMLLSKHIRLIAAFNHMHIFIDPNPDAATSYQERRRLFELPRSTWMDYDPQLISQGGGVFSRKAKSIKVSPEIKQLLNLDTETIIPNDLIRALLKHNVDLLWSGGIGTYVKGSSERDVDVGDRANDAIRINGNELGACVVGEGGNLGLTQLGRVEYALHGGVLYTDFIDNMGGVDSSDHEVNIKILLNRLVTDGDMTLKQRNTLLGGMTDDIAHLVLENSRHQSLAISLAAHRAKKTLDEYKRFMNELEREGYLNRQLEFLPDDEELLKRKAKGEGLTRPEIAVLVAYNKNLLKQELSESNVPENKYLRQFIQGAFPQKLAEMFPEQMNHHQLHREIIVTQLSNIITNEMGATFVKRLYDETGAGSADVVRCFIAARAVFDMPSLMQRLNALRLNVDANIQMDMIAEVIRLLRRATRWFIRNRRFNLNIEATVNEFASQVVNLNKALTKLLVGDELDAVKERASYYLDKGVPEDLAWDVALTLPMISSLDIIEAASNNNLPVTKVAEVYFELGASLNLDWFRQEILRHAVTNNWDALARAAYRDDLDRQQRAITEAILQFDTTKNTVSECIELWLNQHHVLVERWFYMLNDLKSTKVREFSMFAVALRELLDLAQASKAYS